jgi:hypothetical protein
MSGPYQRQTVSLFTPEVGHTPPAGTSELYLETPATVGILYSSVKDSNAELADGLIDLALHSVSSATRVLQKEAGYVKVGPHHPGARGRTIGKYLPAQLRTTTVTELYADQHTDVARVHFHVYVGDSAQCDEDRQMWPVDLRGLEVALPIFQTAFQMELARVMTKALDIEWSTTPGGMPEIVNPPAAQFIKDYPHLVCRGPFRVAHRLDVQEAAAPAAQRRAI